MASRASLFNPSRPLAVATILAAAPATPQSGPPGGTPGNPSSQQIFSFQFWPETLSDSKATEYVEKQVPGGSHPLYQFIRGGARTLTFTAIFTNEFNPENLAKPGGVAGATVTSAPASQYSVDINAAVWSLRRFIYPSYGTSDLKAFPPEFIQLRLPNTAIGGYNQNGPVDIMNAIMLRCDVEYRAWFQDGTPRYATIDMEFAEQVQGSPFEYADIQFVDRVRFSNAWTVFQSKQLTRWARQS